MLELWIFGRRRNAYGSREERRIEVRVDPRTERGRGRIAAEKEARGADGPKHYPLGEPVESERQVERPLPPAGESLREVTVDEVVPVVVEGNDEEPGRGQRLAEPGHLDGGAT